MTAPIARAATLVVTLTACTFNSSGLYPRKDIAPDRPGIVPIEIGPDFRDLPAPDLATKGEGGPRWWNQAWPKRRKLTFKCDGCTEDLKSFPVLVKLDATRIDFATAGPGGASLRFVDSDEQTVLPHQVDQWDAKSSTACLWVGVPQIDQASATDHIYIYHGNLAAAAEENPPAVWADQFGGVWHLSDQQANVLQDSTANQNHATLAGGVKVAPGRIAQAREFDGIGGLLELPDSASLELSVLTVELWFSSAEKWEQAFWPGSGILVSRATSGLSSGDWVLGGGRLATDVGNAGRVIVLSNEALGHSPMGQNTGAFHYVAWSRHTDGAVGRNRLYLDGALQQSWDDDGASIAAARPIQVGNDKIHAPAGAGLKGIIDELRISSVPRSAAWVTAQHASMTDALIDYGAEEPQ